MRCDVHGIFLTMDTYTANIELSNACRDFYRSRLKSTEEIKHSLDNRQQEDSEVPDGNANKRSASFDSAMDNLRREMASLLDQDLSLMKQLLTLNESVEDLKWRHRYLCHGTRAPLSSGDLADVSNGDLCDDTHANDNKLLRALTMPLHTSLPQHSATMNEFQNVFPSLPIPAVFKQSVEEERRSSTDSDMSTDTSWTTTPEEVESCDVVCHSDGQSFDSGIHSDEDKLHPVFDQT